ncbi:histidine kinase [Muricauda sp. 334s03]|uniref:Histidine kinase n=1 Tax=Flagellimonas yonaguniensis TaxID=3031325 RepID=A0ABT5XYZ7_9FLAO|nr:sensor histidine kinase [[Muricauda] yonaguniensis]MDF0716037.1 histidine kinase [[Muricauda] yonaguniensis]
MKNRNLWVNLLIGLGLLSIPILTSPDFSSFKEMIKAVGFQRNFLGYFLLLVFYYFNYYLLVPNFYTKKKRFIYVGALLLCFIVVTYVPDLLFQNLDFPQIQDSIGRPEGKGMLPPNQGGPPKPEEFGRRQPLINVFEIRDSFLIQFITVTILSILLRLDNQLKEIQNEKLKAEVNYLKAQINPHFLFNTLNSIYALTLKKSDQAPWAVLRLSEMMRYVVTESHSEKVPLEYEIQYISDYIELQKLRMGNHTDFTFEIKGNPAGKRIAPIILVNYVENAFKYGVNPDEASKIDIFINIDTKGVELLVQNKITVKLNELVEQTNEGNKNTKKRLDYFYPDKYELNIDHRKDFYSVKLLINLV